MLHPLFIDRESMALLTDLYELTMAAAYHAFERNETATFELSFRRLPENRSYLLAAGLEQALYYITTISFTGENINYLRQLEEFRNVDSGFFDYLREFRFSGDVWAVPEGTVIFPGEPVLQIRAPLIEAQVLETYLLSVLNMQTMVATKAARITRAAQGRGVIDFGSRRAHGPQAALYAARASFIGGCLGTSNVLAAKELNIRPYGTAAHSFTMAFATELEAFRAYYQVFPEHTVLLIDTYDTLAAAEKVKDVGKNVTGVRIDSGDLSRLSKQVRAILDRTGMPHVKILLSGDLNEYKIEELLRNGTPVDLFGVGTELVTSYDQPALSGVYKLVEIAIGDVVHPVMKASPGKISYPGRKQTYRFEKNGVFESDRICLASEDPPAGGVPLLRPVVKNGSIIGAPPNLVEIQAVASGSLDTLPQEFHNTRGTAPARVELSEELLSTTRKLEERL